MTVEEDPRGQATKRETPPEPAPTPDQGPAAKAEQAPTAKPEFRSGRAHRTFLPEVTDVHFSLSRRGYDREQVDRYVERISRIVVELEASRSPDAVIERALADVGEETSAILRRARRAAEEILGEALADAEKRAGEADTRARQTRQEAESHGKKVRNEADEVLRQARAEGEQIVARATADAEQRRQEFDRYRQQVLAHVEELAAERHRLIEDLRGLAETFRQSADRALEQVPEPPEGHDGDSGSSEPAQES